MLWVGVLLSVIIWVIGRESGFLGPSIHVFLLLAMLAALAALLPPRSSAGPGGEPPDEGARRDQGEQGAPAPERPSPVGEGETAAAEPPAGGASGRDHALS